MRVLLADDQIAVRSALHLILDGEPGVEVVGQARGAAELLAQLESCRPDVILLDWELPGRPIDRLLTTLRARVPGVRVVALSARPEASGDAARVGAAAFVSKGDPPERLLAAVRALASPRAEAPPVACERRGSPPGAAPAAGGHAPTTRPDGLAIEPPRPPCQATSAPRISTASRCS